MPRVVRIAFAAATLALVVSSATALQPALDGRSIFRYDTFGDEQLWTKVLRMHEVIPSVSPEAALGAGLKVDVDALPAALLAALQAGQVNLKDPAVTLALLRLNAVVGIIGKFDTKGQLESIGTTCALCHSTVDHASGVGRRLDGWANRDLDVGFILGLSPALPNALKVEFGKWGRGFYDPRHHAFDGRNLIPLNSPSFPVVIPPAYGLQGIGFETVTGEGPVSYWNNYVAVSQMGGQGNFSDPRIGLFISQQPDRVTSKLPALFAYQASLPAPPPPAGSFDAVAAARGERVFEGKGKCSTCHPAPLFTDVMTGPTLPFLHSPSEVGAESVYASRTATKMYRSSPLRGLWQHPPYFHDGHAPTVEAVVDHYDGVLKLHLSPSQKSDLAQYLKSL